MVEGGAVMGSSGLWAFIFPLAVEGDVSFVGGECLVVDSELVCLSDGVGLEVYGLREAVGGLRRFVDAHGLFAAIDVGGVYGKCSETGECPVGELGDGGAEEGCCLGCFEVAVGDEVGVGYAWRESDA